MVYLYKVLFNAGVKKKKEKEEVEEDDEVKKGGEGAKDERKEEVRVCGKRGGRGVEGDDG